MRRKYIYPLVTLILFITSANIFFYSFILSCKGLSEYFVYDIPADILSKRVEKHVEQLLNKYSNNGTYKINNPSKRKMMCDAKKMINFTYLLEKDNLFSNKYKNEALGKRPLFETESFDSCAVMSNSGDILNSTMGKFIDQHDFIIRLNYAPTKGFEKDVGSKTSLRIINSQPLRPKLHPMVPRFIFSDSPVIVWDTLNPNEPLQKWVEKDFFITYFMRRQQYSSQVLFVQHIFSVWSIWKWIKRETTGIKLQTPPTTGFLAFAFAMNHCKTIRLFGFLPKINSSERCHYWENSFAKSCINWHPVEFEKMILISLNEGSLYESYVEGFLTLKGFSEIQC